MTLSGFIPDGGRVWVTALPFPIS